MRGPGRPQAEAREARDQAAKQLVAGLRAVRARTLRGSAPLQGQTRGTGRRLLDPRQQSAVDALLSALGPEGTLQMDPASGTLRHARGDLEDVVLGEPDFLAARDRGDFGGMALATLVGLRTVLATRHPAVEFLPRPPVRDDLGMVHVRLDQRHADLPVLGAQLIVHFDARSRPVEVGGVYAPTPVREVEPRFPLADAEAIARAERAVGTMGRALRPPRVERVLYWNPSVSPIPAYAVDLVPSAVESWQVIVRADDGIILRRHPTTYSAAAIGQSADLLGVPRPVTGT